MSAQFVSQVSEPVQDVLLDAEEEVMKMLESALGPMTSLLDKKFKSKMSHHALMKIINGVINLTLQTVDAATPENEKKVLTALEESGISGKKEKRAGKLSGYTLFTKQMHQDKKEEFKSRGLKGADVTKEIGAMWKKLSEEEKQKFNDAAKKENEENPSASRKSKKGSSKGSRKGSSKGDQESHKCCFVISKGERKGEMCGTTVRSDEPTFEGQWLCSKHATAEKKKSESAKNKKEKKESKKSDKKEKKEKKDDDEEEEKHSKKVKKQVKKDDDEEEEKPSKKVKKQVKKDDDEEEEKPSKKVKKQVKKDDDEEEEKPSKKVKKQVKKDDDEEEEKPSKKVKKQVKKDDDEEEEKPSKKVKKQVKKVVEDEIEDLDEEEESDEEEQRYQVLDDMCMSWEEDAENGVVNGKMTRKSLEKLIGKKLSGEEYDVIFSATKSSLIVKYEEDDEEEMKSIKMDKMNDDLKKVHEYLISME